MAVTYFQDTIFFTDTSLSAPGDGTVLQVASNNSGYFLKHWRFSIKLSKLSKLIRIIFTI